MRTHLPLVSKHRNVSAHHKNAGDGSIANNPTFSKYSSAHMCASINEIIFDNAFGSLRLHFLAHFKFDLLFHLSRRHREQSKSIQRPRVPRWSPSDRKDAAAQVRAHWIYVTVRVPKSDLPLLASGIPVRRPDHTRPMPQLWLTGYWPCGIRKWYTYSHWWTWTKDGTYQVARLLAFSDQLGLDPSKWAPLDGIQPILQINEMVLKFK